jgi:uncharacterized membrane protein
MEYLKQYIISLIVFLGMDSVWLLFIAKQFYAKHIGHLMAEKPNLGVALLFYLLNIFGVLIFVINPALQKNSWLQAVILGMLYGFFTYATYDLTNMATLKDWPLIMTLVDILWGTFLSATASGIVYLILKNIG